MSFYAFRVLLFGLTGVALMVVNKAAPRRYLWLAGFLIPMVTPAIKYPLNMFWYKGIGLVSLLLLPFARRHINTRRGSEVMPLIAYASLVSVVAMGADYFLTERYLLMRQLGLNFAQTVLRMPIQLAVFAFQILAIFVVTKRALTLEDARAAIRGLFAGTMTSAAVGFAMFLTTGRGYYAKEGAGTFLLEGERVARLGGLSGEPKTLGAFCIVLLCLFLAEALNQRIPLTDTRNWRIGLLLAALFFTYSTSAWIGLAAGLASIALFSFRYGRARQIAFFAILIAAGALVGTKRESFAKIIEVRVSDRLFDEEKSELERSKNNYVFDLFSERPLLSMTGFGLGGADLEAVRLVISDSKYRDQLDYIRTPTASVNGARLIGDIGIVGLVLFFSAVWKWRRNFLRQNMRSEALFALSGFVAIMFVSINALTTYLFVLSALLAKERILAESAAERSMEMGIAPRACGSLAERRDLT